MKFIMQEDVRRWYHLFWDLEKGGLFLRIHREYIASMPHKDFSVYFEGKEEELSLLPLFDRYEPIVGSQTFGINDSLILVGSDADWLTYQIRIPHMVLRTGMSCPDCDGTGKRLWLGEVGEDICDACGGTKSERYYCYHEVKHVCYSLQVLLGAIAYPHDHDMPTTSQQVLSITSCSVPGGHGHSVGGYASPSLVKFWRRLSPDERSTMRVDDAERAMYEAHRQLHGEVKSYYDHGFNAFVSNGQLLLRCPENACEIHSDHLGESDRGRGTNITCHNLDSGVQQLTLLAGLGVIASLYDNHVES